MSFRPQIFQCASLTTKVLLSYYCTQQNSWELFYNLIPVLYSYCQESLKSIFYIIVFPSKLLNKIHTFYEFYIMIMSLKSSLSYNSSPQTHTPFVSWHTFVGEFGSFVLECSILQFLDLAHCFFVVLFH